MDDDVPPWMKIATSFGKPPSLRLNIYYGLDNQ